MIELKEALQIVLDAARLLRTERVDMGEALNRILAEDVVADADMPPFDRATVDGYACPQRTFPKNSSDQRHRSRSGG